MSFLSRTKQQDNQYETLMILQESSGFILELPGGEKGPTRFRAFPSFDSNGNELPMRVARDDGFGNVFFEDSDFHDWIYPEYGVRGAGSKGRFTAFFRLKGGGDMDPSPFRVFWRTMGKAIWDDKEKGGSKFPAEWYNWLGSKTDRRIQMEAALKRPGWMILLQGLSYGNRGKDYKDYAGNPAPKYPCVHLNTQTAMASFEEQLNKKRPGVTRAEKLDDFLIPDIISCEKGCLLDIGLTEVAGRKGYAVNAGAFLPLDTTWTRSQRKPWDQVVRLLDAEEQVRALCTYFDKEAVDFALRGSPWEQMLPSEVLGSWDRLSGKSVVPASSPNVTTTHKVAAPQHAPQAPANAAPPPPPPPGGAPRPAAPISATVPFAGAPMKSAAAFNPGVPPPPGAVPKTAQPSVPTNPTGDVATDARNVQSIKERLAAASAALSDDSAGDE